MRAGLRGRSGPSALSPAALGPSREAGLVMSPATPAWALPFRRGHAAWANVIREVSAQGRGEGPVWVCQQQLFYGIWRLWPQRRFCEVRSLLLGDAMFSLGPSPVETGMSWESR